MAPRKLHGQHIKWRSMGGDQMIALAQLIEAKLVEPLQCLGFEWVDVYMGSDRDKVSGREILLERVTGNDIDLISFNFDKYLRPAFQMHIQRRSRMPPYDFIFSANLVKNDRQYIYFWGKPWWFPKKLWSKKMSVRAVEKVALLQDQCLDFLKNGQRGPNISRPVL